MVYLRQIGSVVCFDFLQIGAKPLQSKALYKILNFGSLAPKIGSGRERNRNEQSPLFC